MWLDIDESAYRANPDTIGGTDIANACRSYAHYRQAKDNPVAQTPAMRLGTLIHRAVLEPSRYRDTVIVAPDFGDMRTKVAKDAHAAFTAKNLGMDVITADMSQTINGVVDSLAASSVFSELAFMSDCERSSFWVDGSTELLCRARLDGIAADTIWDLKTCQDARPEAVSRVISQRNYHAQLAHYAKAFETVTGALPRRQILVFVETVAPFGVGVYQLDSSAVARGEIMRVAAMHTIAAGASATVYPDVLRSIELPKWTSYVIDDVV